MACEIGRYGVGAEIAGRLEMNVKESCFEG